MVVLLDTNAWRAVVEMSEATGQNPIELFVRKSVAAPFEVLAELNEIGDQQERRKQLGAFFDLVGPRVLRPFENRSKLEADSGGQLAEPHQYFTSGEVSDLRAVYLSGDPSNAPPSDHREAGHEFAAIVKNVKDAIRFQSTDAERFRREATDPLGLLSIVKGMAAYLGFISEVEDFSPEQMSRHLPSLWVAVEYMFARLAKIVGEKNRVNSSDRLDHFVLSCDPYVDAIVSDDKAMINAAELMLSPPKLLRFDEFRRSLDGDP